MRNRSLEGPRRSVLAELTNGNLIPQQYNPPAMPNYPTKWANGHDYIYRVKFSSTSSLRIGVGAFAALEGPFQSNLATEGHDFDVLKVNLTCVYSLINLGWKAVERTDWHSEGWMDVFLLIRAMHSMCFILYNIITVRMKINQIWPLAPQKLTDMETHICCVWKFRPYNTRPPHDPQTLSICIKLCEIHLTQGCIYTIWCLRVLGSVWRTLNV